MTSVDSTAAASPTSLFARARHHGSPGAEPVSVVRAIAAIAARAAADCYGVVGLAPRYAGLGPVEPLTPERAARGVEARVLDGGLVVDVWVILESGVRVIEVAHNIMVGVAYAVEEALGARVARVNVNIQALRAGPL
ncbi:MAG TPA: Asp23/Gls24 family envelope stress response protein [Ktedonobacterales bacterium]|nr:Asp23/Gls24 family envelope stress response protein [Ktedonobacterales bacterium]